MHRTSLLVLPAFLALTGCGSNGIDGDATEDTTPDTGDTSDEPACETDYPSGPYGVSAGDTIDNLTFASVDGGTYTLHDCFCDDSSKLLLIYATAGWCTACEVESSDLPGVYGDFHDQGLEILAVVFENSSALPATPAYAGEYNDYYGFPFTAVADPDLGITAYFDKTTAPM
ncbi:MAG: redoxin domain-containing protein, partial [Deltaproteobacteria bacterium]|nr:redoxin domain-containing protein [Deltaproteobacteria bacterium]